MIDLDEAPAEFTPAIAPLPATPRWCALGDTTTSSLQANSTGTMDGFKRGKFEPADPTMNRQRNTKPFCADQDTLYTANDKQSMKSLPVLISSHRRWTSIRFSVTDGNTIIAAKTSHAGQVLEITHPWAGQDVEITSLSISPEALEQQSSSNLVSQRNFI